MLVFFILLMDVLVDLRETLIIVASESEPRF